MELVVLVYAALAYWAMGETIYRNKVRIGTVSALFLQRLILGALFGFVLIPVAIIGKVFQK